LLSAKLRAGFDTSDDALRNARLVEEAGLNYLAVHPRRRIDHYRGVADWRIIAMIRRELSIPVIGNGDVWYAASALRLLEETRCDAVMIGRPAMRNPWIFRQIGQLWAGQEPYRPTGADVAQHLRRLAAALGGGYEDGGNPLGQLKEQLGFLARAVVDGTELVRGLLRASTVESFLDAAEAGFTALPSRRLDLGAFPLEGGSVPLSPEQALHAG
jgi:tRNA-dihydrouridine synthase B